MPYFQITEPFTAGKEFFEMVEHYLYLLGDIKSEICNNPCFKEIKLAICGGKDVKSPEEMDNIKAGFAGFGDLSDASSGLSGTWRRNRFPGKLYNSAQASSRMMRKTA